MHFHSLPPFPSWAFILVIIDSSRGLGWIAFDVRYTPLLAALGYGATSIEIYVWLKDGVLLVSLHLPPLVRSHDSMRV